MGTIAILGGKGDTKVIWDPEEKDEVQAAKKTFDGLRNKGYLAYQVDDEDASKGKQIHAFDPDAGRLILAPPMAGG